MRSTLMAVWGRYQAQVEMYPILCVLGVGSDEKRRNSGEILIWWVLKDGWEFTKKPPKEEKPIVKECKDSSDRKPAYFFNNE